MFGVGQRVEIPAHYDSWMRGDRFGAVERITTRTLHVRMDRSGRVVRVPLADVEYVRAV